MRFHTRVTALVAAGALLVAMPSRPALAAPLDDDETPCQVWCDALQALCELFGGGYLCKDMREGCYFGCKLKVI